MTESMKPKLIRGASWQAATRVAINIIGFASTIILARLLTPADFGLVAIAISVQAVAGAIINVAPGSALIRLRRFGRSHLNTAWTLTVMRSVLLAALLCALAWPIALIFEDGRLTAIILVIAIGVVFQGFANPAIIIMSKQLVFWQIFATQVPAKLISIITGVGIAYLTGSYWALVIASVASELVTVAASYIILPYRPRPTLRRFAEIWGFTKWMSLKNVVDTLNYRSDQFLIGGALGNAPLGRYTVGSDLAALPVNEVLTPISATLFPAFSRLNGVVPELRRTFLNAQAVLVMIALPIGFGFAMVAEPVVSLALGEQWAEAAFVIQCLSPVFALGAFGNPVAAIAMTLNRTDTLFRRSVWSILFRLPTIVIGVLWFGFAGIVVARIASGLFSLLLNLLLARQLLEVSLRRQVSSIGRSLTSVAVMSAALGVWQLAYGWESGDQTLLILQLAGAAAAGAAIYVGTHLALWRAAGAGPGPEREVLDIAGKLLSRSR